jgi:hypothetical protein
MSEEDMTDTPLTELLDPDAAGGGTTTVVDEPDDVDDDFDDAAPGRRVPRFTTLLLAAVLVAVGFTGGVLLQKHAVAGTTATGIPSFGAGFPSGAFPGAGAGQLPGAGTSTTTGSSNGSASSAGSPAVIGTVARVDGTTVVVKDFGGKEHKVSTTSDTTITRSASIPANQLKPGQSVRVDGSKTSDGTIVATSVTAR